MRMVAPMMMIATPAVALIFFLFYFKNRYNYTEHLVANIYFAGYSGLVFIFIVAPFLFLAKDPRLYVPGIYGYLGFTGLYRAIGYYQFIDKKGWLYFLKAILASATGIFLWTWSTRWLVSFYIDNGFGIFF